jgi:hypothetical protein
LREFIDANALDRLERATQRLLLLALDIVVVPARQGALRDPVKRSDIGDVGEVNEASDVSEEALGGMSAGRDRWVAGGEEALTAFTLELRSAEDEFNGLIPQGEIFDRLGVMATMHAIAGVTALGAHGDFLGGNDREADRVRGGQPAFVNDLEAREVKG